MDVKEYFETCAARFDGYYKNRKEDLFHRLANKYLREPGLMRRLGYTKQIVGDPKDASILDIGCGSGIYSVYFAKGGADVTGIDFSSSMIDLAKQYAAQEECAIDFVNGHFLEHDFGRTFDHLLFIGVLDYISREDLPKYMEKATSLAAKKVIATFPKKFTPQSPIRWLWLKRQNCPVWFYTKSQIDGLAADFDLTATYHDCGPLWTVDLEEELMLRITRYPDDPARHVAVDMPAHLLPSIDLEDIRKDALVKGEYDYRVPLLVERYLDFFREQKAKITWFVVGEVARHDPGCIKDIIAEGHEIASHTDDHVHLDKQTPDQFRDAMRRNVDALADAGAERVVGFRSPCFSLIESTTWAWDVLKDLGFTYSSSVLPAPNPLYGWRGFNRGLTKLDNGLWELPIAVTSTNGLGPKIPFAGGVYLRALPGFVLSRFTKWYVKRSQPVISYLHPYDIDHDQKHFRVMESRFFDWLMYYNRRSTLPKLGALMKHLPSMRYDDYIAEVERKLGAGPAAARG